MKNVDNVVDYATIVKPSYIKLLLAFDMVRSELFIPFIHNPLDVVLVYEYYTTEHLPEPCYSTQKKDAPDSALSGVYPRE